LQDYILALRKGDYTQGYGYLKRSINGLFFYDIYGVAAEVLGIPNRPISPTHPLAERAYVYGRFAAKYTPPKEIEEKVGIKLHHLFFESSFIVEALDRPVPAGSFRLDQLNDRLNFSFREIALILEKYYAQHYRSF